MAVKSRSEALREALSLIFEEYGEEIIKTIVMQLRVKELVTPTVEWTLRDVEDATFRFLLREGYGKLEGNIKFYLQMAHAIGKGRNPSELYAQLAMLEKVKVLE